MDKHMADRQTDDRWVDKLTKWQIDWQTYTQNTKNTKIYNITHKTCDTKHYIIHIQLHTCKQTYKQTG